MDFGLSSPRLPRQLNVKLKSKPRAAAETASTLTQTPNPKLSINPKLQTLNPQSSILKTTAETGAIDVVEAKAGAPASTSGGGMVEPKPLPMTPTP